ncbi:MAG: hypothetical protein HYU03_02295 [Thaumarchaeota archaeon]|nr:hypothetical protein [Nitrososphaerota archaeon]MCS4539505.1 hypothetical protein [Nitrososphaerota archaeon]
MAIEDDMVKELIRMYRQGTNYGAFWEIVRMVHSFGDMRKDFCVGRTRESAVR